MSCVLYHPEEKYGHEVRVIPVDFTDGQSVYPQIEEKLKDLNIGILGGFQNSLQTS